MHRSTAENTTMTCPLSPVKTYKPFVKTQKSLKIFSIVAFREILGTQGGCGLMAHLQQLTNGMKLKNLCGNKKNQ